MSLSDLDLLLSQINSKSKRSEDVSSAFLRMVVFFLNCELIFIINVFLQEVESRLATINAIDELAKTMNGNDFCSYLFFLCADI